MPKLKLPILWPPDVKNWLVGKDPVAGKDWRQEKGMIGDEVVGWHHQLDGDEFEQALGICDRQWSLVCCSPWGRKSQIQLSNWTELKTKAKKESLSRWGKVIDRCSAEGEIKWLHISDQGNIQKKTFAVIRLSQAVVLKYQALDFPDGPVVQNKGHLIPGPGRVHTLKDD